MLASGRDDWATQNAASSCWEERCGFITFFSESLAGIYDLERLSSITCQNEYLGARHKGSPFARLRLTANIQSRNFRIIVAGNFNTACQTGSTGSRWLPF